MKNITNENSELKKSINPNKKGTLPHYLFDFFENLKKNKEKIDKLRFNLKKKG